jgi:uncharacterized protein
MGHRVGAIAAADVEALAVGSTALGAGGGGRTSLFAAWLRQTLGAGELPVVDVGEPEGWMFPVGIIGASDIVVESLPSGREMPRAVQRMAELTGLTPTALMSVEIGGQNGLAAAVAAHECRLPLADADLMGRALPRMFQFSPVVAGWRYSPVVICSNTGTVVVVEPSRPSEVEDVLRAAMAGSQGWAACAMPPVRTGPVPQVGEGVITGSVTRAVELGRDLLAAVHDDHRPVPGLREALHRNGGRLLGHGRTVDIHRGADVLGQRHSSCTVALDGSDSTLRVEFGSEFLVALLDGEVVATCPDVLSAFSGVDGRPLAVDELRHGATVAFGVLPAAEFWTRPGNLPAVEPRRFGFDVEPVLLRRAS